MISHLDAKPPLLSIHGKVTQSHFVIFSSYACLFVLINVTICFVCSFFYIFAYHLLKCTIIMNKQLLSFIVTPVANDPTSCIISVPNSVELPQVIKIDDLPVFTSTFYSQNKIHEHVG